MSSREKLNRVAKKSVSYVEGSQEQDVLDGEEVLSDVFEPEVNPNIDETENGGEMIVSAPVLPLPDEAELDRLMEQSQQERERLEREVAYQQKVLQYNALLEENRRLAAQLRELQHQPGQRGQTTRPQGSSSTVPTTSATMATATRPGTSRAGAGSRGTTAIPPQQERRRASHQATVADLRQDGRLANGANQTLAALGLLGDSESSDSSSQSEVEEPAELKIRETGKAARRRAKKHRQRDKWAAMCEDITDNMTVNSSNNGKAYVNKMINKDCCSACGSGAESETNNVKWPNQHLGPRYNNYGKSNTKFQQLDFRTLVAGELNICCGRDVSESERSARLKMLGDIVFNSAYYQWPAILKLHAAVLAEIESGNMRWGDEYSKLEQQMLMPFPVNRNKRNGNGDKGGLNSVASSSGTNGNGNRRAQREESSHSEERVVYCGDYQHRNCNNTGNHSGQFYGQNAQLQHICAVCWKRDRVKAVHPTVSTDCPHNEA